MSRFDFVKPEEGNSDVKSVAQLVTNTPNRSLTQCLVDAQKGGNVTQLALLLLCGAQPQTNNGYVWDIRPNSTQAQTHIVSIWEDFNLSKLVLGIKYCSLYEQLLNQLPDTCETARLVSLAQATKHDQLLDTYLQNNSPELPCVNRILSRQVMCNARGTGLFEAVSQALNFAGLIEQPKLERRASENPIQQKYDEFLSNCKSDVKPSLLEACIKIFNCSISVLYVNDKNVIKRVNFINNKSRIIYLAFDGRTYHSVIETPTPVTSTNNQPILVLYYLIENNLTDEASFREALSSIHNLSDIINERNTVKFPNFTINCTVFYYACRSGRIDLVRVLLTVAGLSIDGPQIDSGDSPLHVANFRGFYSIVLILLYGGANINAKNNRGELPQLYRENLDITTKTNLESLWSDIRTLGLDAFKEMYGQRGIEHEIQRDLLEYCASLLSRDTSPDQNELEKVLFPLRDRINEPTVLGSTLLFTACRNGHYMAVKKLLTCDGIEVNGSQSADGSTPLHVTSWRGHVSIVALLLISGATPKTNDLKTSSPAEEYKSNTGLGAKISALNEVYDAWRKNDIVLLETVSNKADINLAYLATAVATTAPAVPLRATVALYAFFDAKEEIPAQYAKLIYVWFQKKESGGRKLLPLHVCSRLDRIFVENQGKPQVNSKIFEPPVDSFFNSTMFWTEEEWAIEFDFNKRTALAKIDSKVLTLVWEPTPPIWYFKPPDNIGPYIPFDFQTCYKVQKARNEKKQSIMTTSYLEEQTSLIRKITSKPAMCVFNFASNKVSIKQDSDTVDFDIVDMSSYDLIASLHRPIYAQLLINPTSTDYCTGKKSSLTASNMLGTNSPWAEEAAAEFVRDVPISDSSPEYKHIVDAFHLTIPRREGKKINRVISIIKRIDPMKRQIWLAKLQASIAKASNSDFKNSTQFVKFLWHGTGSCNPNIITNSNGFMINFSSNRNLWGTGTYFASDANYSATYAYTNKDGTKSLFLAEVIVGAGIQCLENKQIKAVPPIYDTVVGYRHGTWIYVCYDNDVAFPTYLVTWHTSK